MQSAVTPISLASIWAGLRSNARMVNALGLGQAEEFVSLAWA